MLYSNNKLTIISLCFGLCNATVSYLQLQLSVEEAQSQVLQMEQVLSTLQTERDEAQRAAAVLQNSVDQLTQVKKPLSVQGQMKSKTDLTLIVTKLMLFF